MSCVCGQEEWEELDQTGGPAGELEPAAGLSLEEVKAQIIKYQVTLPLLELRDP